MLCRPNIVACNICKQTSPQQSTDNVQITFQFKHILDCFPEISKLGV